MADRASSDDVRTLVASASQQTDEVEAEPIKMVSVVLLRAADRWFAVPSHAIREVVGHQLITPVPSAPPAVHGVAVVHGRLVPVVSLAELMDQPREQIQGGRGTRFVVVGHGEYEMAIAAEHTHAIVDLPAELASSRSERAWIKGELKWGAQYPALVDVASLVEHAILERG